MTTEVSAHLIALQSGRWFAQLPPEFAAALLRMGRIRQLNRGETLDFRPFSPGVVIAGILAILGVITAGYLLIVAK